MRLTGGLRDGGSGSDHDDGKVPTFRKRGENGAPGLLRPAALLKVVPFPKLNPPETSSGLVLS